MYPQIKPPLSLSRAGDALTRASNASRMRFQSPGGILCIYIPYVATSSHTATRRHALESTADGVVCERCIEAKTMRPRPAP